jgi:hypothetical protein
MPTGLVPCVFPEREMAELFTQPGDRIVRLATQSARMVLGLLHNDREMVEVPASDGSALRTAMYDHATVRALSIAVATDPAVAGLNEGSRP